MELSYEHTSPMQIGNQQNMFFTPHSILFNEFSRKFFIVIQKEEEIKRTNFFFHLFLNH